MSRASVVGVVLAVGWPVLGAGCPNPPAAGPVPQPVSDFGRGASDTVISGRATADGKPLTLGAVVFYGDNGIRGEGVVQPDGRYQCGLVLDGPVKVLYSTRRLRPADVRALQGLPQELPPGHLDAPPEPPPGTPPVDLEALPLDGRRPSVEEFARAKAAEARYGNARVSTIKYTVVRGPQTFDVDFSASK